MKENEIQKQCLDYLEAAGYFVWRNHVQGVKVGRSRIANPAAGSPDILAIKGGKIFCIEVKTPTGKLSPHQYTWLEKAHKHGAVSMVVRSVEDLQYCLEALPANKVPFDLMM